MAYQPGMTKELYEGRSYQPAELANFARLGQAMLVVVEERAYEIPANAQGSRPVLLQNAPNPFNASTAISFLIPFRLAGEPTRLSIYNLAGQLVRVLQFETLQAGEHTPELGRPRRLTAERLPAGCTSIGWMWASGPCIGACCCCTEEQSPVPVNAKKRPMLRQHRALLGFLLGRRWFSAL